MFGVDSGVRTQTRRSIVGDAGKTMMSVQQQAHTHSLTIARTLPASQARETISSRTFEHRLEKRRQDQSANEDLQRYHIVNQRLSNNVASDQRVDALRRQKRYQQQNAELNEAYAWENAEREKETRAMLAKQDQELAAAMSAMQAVKIAEEQNIRRICDESEEIQDLKARLKAAELNRTRATQLQEKQLLTTQSHTREAELDAAMEAERRAAVELELQEAERRALVNMQARHVLQGQMEERELKKQLAYEEFLKEKAMVDDVVRAIEADDVAKMKKHLAKQQELQENIRTYLRDRAVWREHEKKRAQDELERIKQYQSQMDERMAQHLREKQRKVDQKDAVLAKLTADIEAKRKEREEMEQLLYELYQEEAESRALAAIRENEERQARMRQEMVDANEEQKAYKANRQAEQDKEEADFRARMMDKFASDARLEAMNQQRRRREMIEYKQEVEHMINERKKIFEQQVEQELQARAEAQREEQRKLDIIERERQRLLSEYAASLKDFLPKGVFRNSQDYQMVYGRPPSVNEQRGHAKAGLYFK